jgi:hypothetical protein
MTLPETRTRGDHDLGPGIEKPFDATGIGTPLRAVP